MLHRRMRDIIKLRRKRRNREVCELMLPTQNFANECDKESPKKNR